MSAFPYFLCEFTNMGSRRRRNRKSRPAPAPAPTPTPAADPTETTTADSDLLVPPEKWIIESISPSDRPRVFGTPRRPGINADQITPKHPDYVNKVEKAMSLRYTAVSVSVFQKEFLKGPGIGARDLRRLGNFEQPTSATESDLYPVLVCHSQ